MSRRSIISLTSVLFASVLILCSQAATPNQNWRVFNRYVYLVKVRTTSTRHALTGFRMKGVKGIITALHGVVDAHDEITVKSVAGVPDVGVLELYDVDIDHDLARLSSPKWEMLGDDGFEPAIGGFPSSGMGLTVVGYPLNVDRHSLGVPLVVGTPSQSSLEGMVNPDLRIKLQSRKSPSVTLPVLFVTGAMQPGHSGGPILDMKNRVVAVASGGLRTSSNLGWGIPWHNIRWVKRVDAELQLSRLRRLGPTGLFTFETNIENISEILGVLKVQDERILELEKRVHTSDIRAAELKTALARFSQADANPNQVALVRKLYRKYGFTDAQAEEIFSNSSLSDEEKVTSAIESLITSIVQDNANQANQANKVASLDNAPSIDIETMKLKRQIDKRSQMFDMLRQIIDKYNETAKGIIDSIGR